MACASTLPPPSALLPHRRSLSSQAGRAGLLPASGVHESLSQGPASSCAALKLVYHVTTDAGCSCMARDGLHRRDVSTGPQDGPGTVPGRSATAEEGREHPYPPSVLIPPSRRERPYPVTSEYDPYEEPGGRLEGERLSFPFNVPSGGDAGGGPGASGARSGPDRCYRRTWIRTPCLAEMESCRREIEPAQRRDRDG
jgi:hypothetical protein